MNRELKFRAWNSRYGMNRESTLLALSTFNCRENGIHTTEVGWPKDTVFMQFTGLKDKNGKDIYEGDILEFDADEWGSTKGNRWAVEWDDESGEWLTGGGTNRECKSFKTVIGNIYDNPDLLK